MKKCSKCKSMLPLTDFLSYKKTKTIFAACKKCVYERHHKSYMKRRMERKLESIKILGGKCMNCGYNKNPYVLDFDHIDPSKKSGSVTKMIQKRTWKIIKSELKKCVLLCANCHREKTFLKYYKSS